MKLYGYEISDYNLPSNIRSRINDLVNFGLNPSTINLITSEFSAFDEEIKENIGRYIARLLEVENIHIEQQHIIAREQGIRLNIKKDIELKQRQANLLRIQQIFSSKDITIRRQSMANNSLNNNTMNINDLNYKQAMFVKNANINEEELNHKKLEELANKKRIIQLAIEEEQEKIKVAKKQYLKAKANNDEITQELKLNIIKFSNQKLEKMDKAIKKYKSLDKIPLDIFKTDDQTIDLQQDESNLRNSLKQKSKNILNQLKNDFNNNLVNTIELNNNYDLENEDFFYVPGFEDDYDDEFNNQFNNSKPKYIQKTSKNDNEKIISKFKKKVKEKDKKLSKYEKENKKLKTEIEKTKEIKKEKSLNNIEKTIKKERQKAETSFLILEKKWEANKIKQDLEAKKRAKTAVEKLQEKNKPIKKAKDAVKNLNQKAELRNKAKTAVEKLQEKNKPIKKAKDAVKNLNQKAELRNKAKTAVEKLQEKNNHAVKIKFDKPVESSISKLEQQKQEERKKQALLEQKEKMNMLSNAEKQELEILKKKNKHISNKVNLKRFKLIKRV